MPQQTYKNWKAVTEADFVSLFIKTWFAYISTLRALFPEAKNRRGDGKYLIAFKDYYQKTGYKKLNIDDAIMTSLELLYQEGRKVILKQYPEYYLWDFYNINEEFSYTFKDIPPDKSDCLVVGLKLLRKRGTKRSFELSGFSSFWGRYYGKSYSAHIPFSCNLTSILEKSPNYIKENPNPSEQDYLSWLVREISTGLSHEIIIGYKSFFETTDYGDRIKTKVADIEKRVIAVTWQLFALTTKDESMKSEEEMHRPRNTYEVVRQRPLNYYQYHFDVKWAPQRKLEPFEVGWYKDLEQLRRKNSILWFLDFVYRLRNALFHEIIDPLDEEWQIIFKNAYLVLKEIVDLNISEIQLAAEASIAVTV